MRRADRAAQRLKVVSESGGTSTRSKREPRQLPQPPIDYDALGRKPFLTVRESMAYLSGFTSAHAFRQWVHRNGVPKCRVGRSLRFRRRDLDRSVNATPTGEP